jgi:hypothetical protein
MPKRINVLYLKMGVKNSFSFLRLLMGLKPHEAFGMINIGLTKSILPGSTIAPILRRSFTSCLPTAYCNSLIPALRGRHGYFMDEDEDEIAQVTYGIKSGGKGVFDVKEQNGIIHLRSQPPNSARKAQYKLKEAAIDRGDRKAFEDAVLEILVENSANYLDFGSSSGYHFVVVELDNSIHHHRTISLHQAF